KPTMPTAMRATSAVSVIDAQLRPCRTLTGVIGGRPPPLPPVFAGGVDLPADLAPAGVAFFALAAGRVDGRRLPPVCGLLMLMGPRRDRFGSGRPGVSGNVPHCDRHVGSPPS